MDLKTVIEKYKIWSEHSLAQHVFDPNQEIDLQGEKLFDEWREAWNLYFDEKGLSEISLTHAEMEHIKMWMDHDNFTSTYLQRLLTFADHNKLEGFLKELVYTGYGCGSVVYFLKNAELDHAWVLAPSRFQKELGWKKCFGLIRKVDKDNLEIFDEK